jgi:hypothetical protein
MLQAALLLAVMAAMSVALSEGLAVLLEEGTAATAPKRKRAEGYTVRGWISKYDEVVIYLPMVATFMIASS